MEEKREENNFEADKKEKIEIDNSEKESNISEDKSEEKKSETNNTPQVYPDKSSKKISTKGMKNEFVEKARENPWMVSSVVMGILLLGFLFTGSSVTGGVITGGTISDEIISAEVAGETFESFASSRGVDVKVLNIEEKDGFYEISFSSKDGDSFVLLTMDGKNIANLIPLNIEDKSNIPIIPKSDKPEAELFIMTHCPFGTQAEKGFIPTIKALEGVADLKIRFVHYFMHTPNKEDVETPRQVCIREEQSEKYLDYLECFLGGTSGSVEEALACEAEIEIDSEALADCIDSGRAEEYYAEDSALSKEYGVKGSPSLVVNGVQIMSQNNFYVFNEQKIPFGRDSETYSNVICSLFNDVPEECMQELSSASPSSGFGYDASGASATTASCS